MPYPKTGDMIPVTSQLKIKYKDIFDLKEFYTALYNWLLENDWRDCEDKDEKWETFYSERIGRTGLREIWFRWRVVRDAKEGPFKYYLFFDFHVLALSDTEVVKNGVKMKLNKGEIEFTIRPFIYSLYEKPFKEYKWLAGFLDLFNKRVYHSILEERKKELYQETYALQNFIKQWFKLKRYLPYEESKSFFPSYAWPSHLKE